MKRKAARVEVVLPIQTRAVHGHTIADYAVNSVYVYINLYYISNSNCPMKKQHLYHVIMWFFTVFHSNSWFRNAAWDTIISHGRSTVGYYSIPRSRVKRGHHALKQYGVRELLFVISYRRFDLTKDFQDVYVTFNDPRDTCSNILKRKRQKLRYT
jgi:hypothetical protein